VVEGTLIAGEIDTRGVVLHVRYPAKEKGPYRRLPFCDDVAVIARTAMDNRLAALRGARSLGITIPPTLLAIK
jgi:hypothetical protein